MSQMPPYGPLVTSRGNRCSRGWTPGSLPHGRTLFAPKMVDSSVTEAQAAAQMMIQEGRTDFSFTGPASGMPHYPTTENWQKTLGNDPDNVTVSVP